MANPGFKVLLIQDINEAIAEDVPTGARRRRSRGR